MSRRTPRLAPLTTRVVVVLVALAPLSVCGEPAPTGGPIGGRPALASMASPAVPASPAVAATSPAPVRPAASPPATTTPTAMPVAG